MIDGSFLTDFPSILRDRGEYNKVPEIIGINDDESSIWVVWGMRGNRNEKKYIV